MSDHMIIALVGGGIGILQAIIIFMIKLGIAKIGTICQQIATLQQQMTGKAELSDHKKVEVQLGQFGDRILTLELAVKVIERGKE